MKKIAIVFLLVLTGCASPQPEQDMETLSEPELLLEKGYKLISERNTKKAIAEFEKVISLCKDQYSNNEKKSYTSRDMTETIYYMLKAAAEEESAIVVDSVCSDALYLKGYASLDLGQVELAEKYVKKAVDMAPVNSMYLSELGHIYQVKLDWEKSLSIFVDSEEAAKTYSPPGLREKELSRAKRGVGYNLIEIGKLDEAEKKFRECLEINENDEGAIRELNYIEHLRNERPANI